MHAASLRPGGTIGTRRRRSISKPGPNYAPSDWTANEAAKSARSARRGHRGHIQKLSPQFRTIQICPKDLLATLREAERVVGRPLGSVGCWCGHSRAGEVDVRHQTA